MTVEYTPDGTPYLSDQSYLSETPPYTQELAQIIDAGGGGGVSGIKDSSFNDLQPADPISPYPIGMLAPFMGENAPDGWLLCDGRSYDAVYFYALAEANPDFHGDGTFRVPDLRGRSPIGATLDFADAAQPAKNVSLGSRHGDWRVQAHGHSVTSNADPAGPAAYWVFSIQTSPMGDSPSLSPTVMGTGPMSVGAEGPGWGRNYQPSTGVNFIVYSGRPTLDINGDILPECGQGAEIAPVTTRMMIEARLADAGIGEEEVKMLKERLEEVKKTEAK